MPETICVKMLDGTSRSVVVGSCTKLNFTGNDTAIAALAGISRALDMAHGRGGFGRGPDREQLLRSNARITGPTTQEVSVIPRAIYRDPIGTVFAEITRNLLGGVPSYLELPRQSLMEFLSCGGFHESTVAEWSTPTFQGVGQQKRRRRNRGRKGCCLEKIQEAFDRFDMAPTLKDLAERCTCGSGPPRKAYNEFFESMKYLSHRRGGGEPWGENMRERKQRTSR
jgi:hypothetical protein